jgi:hypothetical protein
MMQSEVLEKKEKASNFLNLPDKFSAQILNADKLHASLQKAGLEGYFHVRLQCIIIISKKRSTELQEILNDGTEYSNWKPKVEEHRDYEGHALIFLR